MGKGVVSIGIAENNGKLGSMRITSNVADETTVQALADAIAASTLGKVKTASLSTVPATFTPAAGAAPTSAQRGQKLLVKGIAAVTGTIHHCEIPCWNPTSVAAAGSDNVPVPGAIKSALDAVWTDDNGNAIVVEATGIYVNRSIQ